MSNFLFPMNSGDKRQLIENPGDRAEIRMTKKRRIVATVQKGNEKYSRTLYPSGRVHETHDYTIPSGEEV